jgi:nicotinamidase-related amidase
MTTSALPLPPHYDSNRVVEMRYVDYDGLLVPADNWAAQHSLKVASTDKQKVVLLGIDVQNTFCDPAGELFVAGRSGMGAVDDSRRLAEFIYRNLHILTELEFTLDTHRTFAIFHRAFLKDSQGNYPAPFTVITNDDVKAGKWQVTPRLASALGVNLMAAQKHLEHYTAELKKRGRYELTIWPFHGMLGGIGHALVSGVAEAAHFHAAARGAQSGFEIKGTNPYTENYSVLGPEVTTTFNQKAIDQKNARFLKRLLDADRLIITGQAKSHCVAWTIDDLLEDILKQDPSLASKVYLLEDCSTSIAIPDGKGGFIADYGPDADKAFERFANAGMHLVKSTDPIENWPDFDLVA